MKANKKQGKRGMGFPSGIVAVLICFVLILSCTPAALAMSSEIHIDETKTLLEDSDTAGEGYLVVEASTPEGFEGILCVELRKKNSARKVTVQISPADFYMGGQYLELGDYSVKKAFALNDKTAIVETDREELTVAADGDAHLYLTVSTDPAAEEAWLAMMETYTMPELPTEQTTAVTQKETETVNETEEAVEAEETIQLQIEELEDPSPSIWRTVWSLLKSLALTALFGGAVYYLVEKFRK